MIELFTVVVIPLKDEICPTNPLGAVTFPPPLVKSTLALPSVETPT